ncbi:peptidase M23, partial [Corynebacterium diphtheriae]
TYKYRCYASHFDDAKKACLPCAAYHYLRNPSECTTIAQQVQSSIEVMGERRLPMWIDVETEAGLHVDHIRQRKRLFEAAGVPVSGAYSYV